MRRFAVVVGASILIAHAGLAQSVRGIIVDDVRQLPIRDAAVTLVREDGSELPGVRSDSVGRFTVHSGVAGTYRVKAIKLGYSPSTSDPISIQQGGLVIVRITMTQRVQELGPIRVVERRKLSVGELMSGVGFDLRSAKGQGHFLDSTALRPYGRESGIEVLRTYLRAVIMVAETDFGPMLAVRNPNGTPCTTTAYLDGNRLSPTSAYATLDGLAADQLYGVEVYRKNELPPPSMGAFLEVRAQEGAILQTTPDSVTGCIIAVWTKSGSGIINALKGPGQSGIQVVKGTVVDFDTGLPVPGIPIHLLTEAEWPLGAEVVSDSAGEFAIRTTRVGRVRLRIDRGGRDVKGPVFQLSPEELLITKIFVSAKPVEVPMGIAARVLPEKLGPTNPTSFAYRRERNLVGTFFGPIEAARLKASTVEQLLQHVDGITVDDSGLFIRRRGSEQSCAAVVLLNGARTSGADSVARRVPTSSMLGIEIYFTPAEVPFDYADPTDGCGMIGIWTRPTSRR